MASTTDARPTYPTELGARDLLRFVREQWWVVAVVTAAITVVAVLATSGVTVQHRATVSLAVADTGSGAGIADPYFADVYLESRIQSYPAVATSPLVLEPIVADLGLAVTATELADRVAATAPTGERRVELTVSGPEPGEAERIADAVAIRFAAVVEALERAPSPDRSPVALTVLGPADTTASSSATRSLAVAGALVGGLALGLALAVLRGLLGRRISSIELLSALTGAAPLDEPLALPPIIAVVSARDGEGRAGSALALARALALADRQVCLVEADLHRPSLAGRLGLDQSVGLTSVLDGSGSITSALRSTDDGLTVLAAGPVPSDPTALLNGAVTPKLIAALGRHFDHVVIDTAALLDGPDALPIAVLAGATVLVARARRTTLADVAGAMAVLDRADLEPARVVLEPARPRRSGQPSPATAASPAVAVG